LAGAHASDGGTGVPMKSTRWLGISFLMMFVFLWGCGNNGGSNKTATVINYTSATAVYTKGVAITPDNPTVSGGSVAGYAVTPSLPAGLILNASTGVMSGTPTTVAAKETYTVTAFGSSGTAAVTVTITVNDQAPSALTYAAGIATYTVAVPITPNNPANAGGTVTSYSVSPAVPAGLNFSTTTGVIRGVPTAAAAAARYTITATNTGGSTTAAVTIAVNAAQAPSSLAAPAGLAYHPGSAIYSVGVRIPENVPTSTGGAPLSYKTSAGLPVPAYSVSPPLPAGLFLSGAPVTLADNATGVISGIPQAASPMTTYTVTARNPFGSTTATLDLTVNAAGVSPSGLAYMFPAPVFDGGLFNRVLWKGLMGNKPYPAAPTGLDLRQNRDKLLASYRQSIARNAIRTARPARD
jgi:hypothetical protein